MGNDTPDWSGQYNTQSFYPLSDLAEVAVRLGSPFAFDRRGSVFWYDDFEWGLDQFSFQPDGSSSDLNLITTPVYHGPFAADLFTGPENNSQGEIIRNMEVILSGKIGGQALFRTRSNDQEIILRLDIYNGTTQWQAEVKLTYTGTTKVEVTNGSGHAELTTGVGGGVLSGTFAFVKIVVDVDATKLERVIFGPYEWDVSAYTPKTIGATTDRLLVVTIAQKVLNATGLQELVIDMVAITGAEPPN